MKLTVKTNVAAYVRKLSDGSGVKSVADDFLPALEAKTKKAVEEAVERARANGRKTVMGKDM